MQEVQEIKKKSNKHLIINKAYAETQCLYLHQIQITVSMTLQAETIDINNIVDKKQAKKNMHQFAEIEPFYYLCNLKEIKITRLVKKSDEFSVMLIQWLS